jgi:polysaccharide chain length determinant protein (PEP-CTERM system associated)
MRPLVNKDYMEIWSRQKWWFFAAVFLIASGTAIVAALLPKMFTSECLILLEGQPVTPDGAAAAQRPGGDPQVEQQLTTLTQEALSRTRLEKILRDVGYISPVDKPTDSSLDEFRSKVEITILKDNDPRRAAGPYGIKISYVDHNPANAQRITNELASFIVSERLKSQEETSQETNQYLQNQLDAAYKDLDEKQHAFTNFKTRYNGELPIDEPLTVQSLMRLQTQLQVSQQAVERARQEVAAVENPGQVSTTSTHQNAADSATAKLSSSLGQLQANLADLLSRDTPTHPDVIKTKAEIARVKEELAKEQAAEVKPPSPDQKPAVANVSTTNLSRRNDASAEIVARQAEQKRIQEDIQHYQDNLQQIPLHSQQYADLERQYQDAQNAFDALKKKVDDSLLTNNMNARLQGQRLSIQDFASLPQKPSSPVYWKIDLGGLGAAFLFGIILAGAMEFGDSTMKSDRDVEYYLQTKILATVPVLPLLAETRLVKKRKQYWFLSTVPVILLVCGLIGYLYLIRK